jgi:hypothetical protein
MSIEITTVVKTCRCGMVYSVPNWMEYRVSCPSCSHQRITELEELFDEMDARQSRLRGVITRMKNAAQKNKE